jgi:zinc protease
MTHVRLGFHAGARFDPPPLAGLSELAAQLLKEGTETRPARRFAEEVASIGGTLDARSTPDFLIASGSALSEHTAKLLALLADMTRHACFPDEEVELRKQNRLQELAHERSLPDVLAAERLCRLVFGDHPYSRLLPAAESIQRIGRDELVAFRSGLLRPQNAVLVLVGPLGDRRLVIDAIESHFGDWKADTPLLPAGGEFPEPARSFVLVDRSDSVQVDIRAGRRTVNRTHPDYFPLLVANTVLGSGASSRLFRILREQMGFGYDAHSQLEPRRQSVLFTAETQVRPEVAAAALEALLDQLRSLAREPVTAEELQTAQNFLTGTFAISLETPGALAGQLLSRRLNGLPADYLETFVPRVRAVTAGQVLAAAARYFDPQSLAIVLVGDASRVATQLEQLGPLQIEQATS